MWNQSIQLKEREREARERAIGQIAPDLARCTTEHYSLKEGREGGRKWVGGLISPVPRVFVVA